MGVRPLLLQGEGRRPVAQVLRVRVRIVPSGPPGLIEEPIRRILPLPVHVEAGGPVGIQGDVPGPGELLAPPLQEEVRIVGGVGVGVGVPDEKSVVLPRLPGVRLCEDQEDAVDGTGLEDIQALRKKGLQELRAPLTRAHKSVHAPPGLLQIPRQDGVDIALPLADGGPALVHVVLQDHTPVLHQAAHHTAGVLLQGLGGPPDDKGTDGDGALHEHDADEGQEEHSEDSGLFPGFTLRSHGSYLPQAARRASQKPVYQFSKAASDT